MNYIALFKALRFACLPTLSVLVLLFFGFFSITETLSFISSSNGWAIAIRITCMLGELVLVFLMYEKFVKEEIRKKYDTEGRSYVDKRRDSEFRHIFNSTDSYDLFRIYDTESPNIKIIEHFPNKSI